MEVILRQDLDDLGLQGDIVNVSKGYARNFLIPRGVALEATPQNRKALELQRKKIEVGRLKAKEDAEKVRDRLDGIRLSIPQKAGEEGKLYGSVTTMDIASYLEAEGVTIDRKKIVLDKPIKTLGEYEIPVKVYPGVTATLKVAIQPEEQVSR